MLSLNLYDRKNINTPDPRCANSSHFEKVPASLMETESVLSLNGYDRGDINTPDSWCANSSHFKKIPPCLMEASESVSSLNGYDRGNINIPDSRLVNSSHLGKRVTGSRRILGGMGSRHFAAASPRRFTTSAAFGRRFLSESQQSWVKSHSESENPISEAFSGLSGRFPITTATASSVLRRLRNGISPVRT